MLLFISMFLACQNELAEMTRANELLDKEKKLEALRIYEDVKRRYPDTQDAKSADERIERIYNNAAKSAQKESLQNALKITQVQLQRWPRGLYAAEASNRKSALEDAIKEDERLLREDRKLCEETKKIRTVEAWQTYLASFPTGICHEEGQKKVRLRPAEEEEIASLREILPRCTEMIEECKRLSGRYEDLRAKNEVSYLQSTFYDYLSIRVEQFVLAKQEGEAFVESLYQNDVDTVSLIAELNQTCSGCSENMLQLKELQACKEAMATEGDASKPLWESYLNDFPDGSCQRIAKDKLR
ncbi:MAG: hypothetical protein VX278_01265 [Myxococcota bacterium]|nr:hypothetical protein [Myxococcota bacterium]